MFVSRKRLLAHSAPTLAAAVLVLASPGSALAAPGDLDPAFSGDGLVTTDFAAHKADAAHAVAIQSDGKIVTAGETQVTDVEFGSSPNAFGIARYNTDGSLDASFGGQNGDTPGTTTTEFFCDGPADAQAQGAAIQPDGKIVVAGFMNDCGTLVFAVARYTTDGLLDPSFGGKSFDTPGTTTQAFANGGKAYAVAIQPDGVGGFKIVVAGTTADDFAIARFDPSDGSLDTSFDGDGMETEGTSAVEDGRALAIQPDRSIVVAGSSDGDFAAIRLGHDGGLDAGFGEPTVDLEGHDDAARGVALQSDGSIVLAGYATRDDGSGGAADRDFALARLDSTGALDAGFGSSGKVLTPFGGLDDVANGVAVYPDGRIVAAGLTKTGGSAGADFALARYSAGGMLDSAFGAGGLVITDFGDTNDVIDAVTLQSDGKIVVAGFTAPQIRVAAFGSDFALARYGLSAAPAPGPTPQTPVTQTVPSTNPCAGDGAGPSVNITSLQSTAEYGLGSKASVAVTASDPSGLSVDPSDPAKSLPTSTTGSRTISAEAVDNCGNHGTTTFSYRVVGRPKIAVRLAACRARTARVRVRVTANAALRVITTRVDGRGSVTRVFTGGRTARGSQVRTAGLKPGTHTVTVVATDRLGNTTRRSFTFTVCGAFKPKFTG